MISTMLMSAMVLAYPEQIHIAHKNANSMWVSWLDRSYFGNANLQLDGKQVFYALPKYYTYQSAYGEPQYTSPAIYHAEVTGLNCGETHSYRVGSDSNWSPYFNFTTLPCVGPNEKVTIALIGDLGQTVNSSNTVDHIVEGTKGTDPIQLAWLVGDLSYADSSYGPNCGRPGGCTQTRWDSWGNMVQKMSANIPLMTGPGNHEQEDSPTPKIGVSYLAYKSRMVGPDGGSADGAYWWSMEVAGVHMITLNSYMDYTAGSPQYTWLEQDLKKVDRKVTPWLVVGLHAPWYNSNVNHQNETEEWGMRKSMEPLLHQYGVDILFCGHVHAYERSHPVYNYVLTPGAMTEINIGDGGNREVLAADPLDWVQPQPNWSAFRQNKFGHGRFTVYNSTHARWSWHTIDTPETTISDPVWFVKAPAVRGVVAYPIEKF
eukprot:TRINITY_DN3890_c0_g3_i1.p1 TRINITY_DN3890_c0_g3~~TRINITY_DN3890_c0_g3_i1.p1  ORF type:complete len:430 (+),score=90.85 TRINITY_DN3890_c0_g3_i1:67-1356(+)